MRCCVHGHLPHSLQPCLIGTLLHSWHSCSSGSMTKMHGCAGGAGASSQACQQCRAGPAARQHHSSPCQGSVRPGKALIHNLLWLACLLVRHSAAAWTTLQQASSIVIPVKVHSWAAAPLSIELPLHAIMWPTWALAMQWSRGQQQPGCGQLDLHRRQAAHGGLPAWPGV